MRKRLAVTTSTFVSIALLSACATAAPAPAATPTPEKPIEVRYEVLSTSKQPSWVNLKTNGPSADLTAEMPTGTSQITVDLPLKNKSGDTGLTMSFKPGSFVYVSAQKGDYIGNIICRIYVDDVLISENEATGAHSIASCKGSV